MGEDSNVNNLGMNQHQDGDDDLNERQDNSQDASNRNSQQPNNINDSQDHGDEHHSDEHHDSDAEEERRMKEEEEKKKKENELAKKDKGKKKDNQNKDSDHSDEEAKYDGVAVGKSRSFLIPDAERYIREQTVLNHMECTAGLLGTSSRDITYLKKQFLTFVDEKDIISDREILSKLKIDGVYIEDPQTY